MLEAEAVLGEQFTELGFKFDLFFQCSVASSMLLAPEAVRPSVFLADGIRQVFTLLLPEIAS